MQLMYALRIVSWYTNKAHLYINDLITCYKYTNLHTPSINKFPYRYTSGYLPKGILHYQLIPSWWNLLCHGGRHQDRQGNVGFDEVSHVYRTTFAATLMLSWRRNHEESSGGRGFRAKGANASKITVNIAVFFSFFHYFDMNVWCLITRFDIFD